MEKLIEKYKHNMEVLNTLLIKQDFESGQIFAAYQVLKMVVEDLTKLEKEGNDDNKG